MDTETKPVIPSHHNLNKGSKDMVILGIILFLFFASFSAMFGVSVYELVKKEPETELLFLGEESTQLQVTTSWTTLYNFYTDSGKYRGEYKVVLSNSTGVNFRVVDQDTNVLGSVVNRGGNYLESTIQFNSGGKSITNIILQYTSTNNSIVSRIEIVLD